jgi:hypothetical protein
MISDRLDSHWEKDVRRALERLVALADKSGAVILGIAHFNKGSGSDIPARITGSGAFKNVPRAVFGSRVTTKPEIVFSPSRRTLWAAQTCRRLPTRWNPLRCRPPRASLTRAGSLR